MGFLDKFLDKDKVSNITIGNPKDYLNVVLKSISGTGVVRDVKYNIFYQIIAFKGVMDGVGTSTLVANTALALADAGLTVLVVDTSILQPCQDILLKTGEKEKEKEHLDWFDMPYTKLSVLHESKLTPRISVLSFYGKNRNITDILSTNDSAELVDMAFTEFHNKFDIILVDCCHELTNINTTALQMSQKVIQVWNDSPTVISNLDNFISNCVTLCCPLDKMRFVVYSKDNPDVIGGLDDLVKQYRLKKITQTFISRDVNRIICQGRPVWSYETQEKDVLDYNMGIIDIVKHLLSVDVENAPSGTITSDDIMEGKVDGTLSKAYSEQDGVEVATTLEQADEMLNRPLTRAEKKQQKEEERRRVEEERQRAEEEKRRAKEEEKQRIAEEKRLAKEAKKKKRHGEDAEETSESPIYGDKTTSDFDDTSSNEDDITAMLSDSDEGGNE